MRTYEDGDILISRIPHHAQQASAANLDCKSMNYAKLTLLFQVAKK